VKFGSNILVESKRLSGTQVGLLCNHASVDENFRHIADRLLLDENITLGAVFGPQHGVNATVQDNMIETPHGHNNVHRTPDGLLRQGPVYSLYSETREPTAEMLHGLDVLIIDLQDVGARVYTYIYTMANCLRACQRHKIPVIVCDRPNPIGGVNIEGETLLPGFESFVGQFPIPMRHGMTIGELATLFNNHFGIDAKLEVISMQGWHRADYWDTTGLPWIMPSPNMPTLDSAIVYPGTVLFEGTMLSEGRGTTRPFELVGAPWIEAERFAAAMNALTLPGVQFRPTAFLPTFQKHAQATCGGCQIHVVDRKLFRPVLTGVALISVLRQFDKEEFAWKQPPYEYEHNKTPFDILSGSDRLRRQIEDGQSVIDIAANWKSDETAFNKARKPFLLYEN